MRFPGRPSQTDMLATFWNELTASLEDHGVQPSFPSERSMPSSSRPEGSGVEGSPAAADAPGRLDPTFVQSVVQLHAHDDAQLPDSDFFTNLEQTLMETAQTMQPVLRPLTTTQPLTPNGRTKPDAGTWLPAIGAKSTNRRWAMASLVAALVILLAGFGSCVVYDRYFSGRNAPHHNIIPAALLQSDWPMYRGDPARTSSQEGLGPIGQPVELWTFQTGGPAYRSPAIAGGIVFQGSSDGYIYAVSAATGQEIWRFQGDASLEMTPSVIDETVYISSAIGTLYALDALTGELRWTFAEPLSELATPTYADGLLFAGSIDGNLYAIDAGTGDEAWRFEIGVPVSRPQATGDGIVFTGAENGHLYAVSAADGAELWRFDVGGGAGTLVGTPTVDGGLVYTGVNDDSGINIGIAGIDVLTGEERVRFENPTEGRRLYGPVLDGGRAYFGSDNGSFYGIDIATGDVIWEVATDDFITAVPVVVGHVLYGASHDHHVYAIDTTSGTELWSYELDGEVDFGPSVAGGVLYISTDAGTLYAIAGVRDAPATPVTTPAPAAVSSSPSADTATPEATQETTPVVPEPIALWRFTPEDVIITSATVDHDDNIWIANGLNDNFLILSPDGDVIEEWGVSGRGDGEFDFSRGFDDGLGDVAFAQDGSFYVADLANRRVQKFNAERNFLFSFGMVGRGDGQFLAPFTVRLDSQGNVYVVDDVRDDIQKFDSEGNHLLTFGGHGRAEGQISFAGWATIDAQDTIWVADIDNNRIQQFDSDGNLLQVVGAGLLNRPQDIAVDDDSGLLYVTDTGNHRVVVFDRDGTYLTSWDGTEGSGTAFFETVRISLDGQGNLIVTDYGPGGGSSGYEAVQKFALLTE